MVNDDYSRIQSDRAPLKLARKYVGNAYMGVFFGHQVVIRRLTARGRGPPSCSLERIKKLIPDHSSVQAVSGPLARQSRSGTLRLSRSSPALCVSPGHYFFLHFIYRRQGSTKMLALHHITFVDPLDLVEDTIGEGSRMSRCPSQRRSKLMETLRVVYRQWDASRSWRNSRGLCRCLGLLGWRARRALCAAM